MQHNLQLSLPLNFISTFLCVPALLCSDQFSRRTKKKNANSIGSEAMPSAIHHIINLFIYVIGSGFWNSFLSLLRFDCCCAFCRTFFGVALVLTTKWMMQQKCEFCRFSCSQCENKMSRTLWICSVNSNQRNLKKKMAGNEASSGLVLLTPDTQLHSIHSK